MNWEIIFELYLRHHFARKSALVLTALRGTSADSKIRPDLKDLKTAYDLRGQLHLADVKPAGLLVRSRG